MKKFTIVLKNVKTFVLYFFYFILFNYLISVFKLWRNIYLINIGCIQSGSGSRSGARTMNEKLDPDPDPYTEYIVLDAPHCIEVT